MDHVFKHFFFIPIRDWSSCIILKVMVRSWRSACIGCCHFCRIFGPILPSRPSRLPLGRLSVTVCLDNLCLLCLANIYQLRCCPMSCRYASISSWAWIGLDSFSNTSMCLFFCNNLHSGSSIYSPRSIVRISFWGFQGSTTSLLAVTTSTHYRPSPWTLLCFSSTST